MTKLISNYKLLLYKVKSKFGGIVTKLISNYTLLLYKLKSKFGATVVTGESYMGLNEMIQGYMMQIEIRMHPHLLTSFQER